MSEQPIYCPNGFTLEQWGSLSREEQIRWWKEYMPERRSRPLGPLGLLKMYRKGHITQMELVTAILSRLTVDNVRAFLDGCPADILAALREIAERMPDDADEQGWGQLIRIDGALYCSWVTEDEIRKAREEDDRRLREGVRVFRACMRGVPE